MFSSAKIAGTPEVKYRYLNAIIRLIATMLITCARYVDNALVEKRKSFELL